MAKRVHLSEEEIVKDRLAWLGTLAGGLAHEIRSPLNSIHINVELLERNGCRLDAGGEESFRKRIGRIKEEIAHLQKTLTEFLQFAKPPGIQRMATRIEDFLHDAVEFIQPELAGQGVRLKIECDEHTYPILIDRRQMGQVVQNLVFNSRDAIQEGGGGTIVIRSVDEETHVLLEVEDDGPGMDEEVQARVFEAFFTTKEKGTGLGLGISRRIVYEHGGAIAFKSPVAQGRGTRFSVRLPKEKLLARAGAGEEAPA